MFSRSTALRAFRAGVCGLLATAVGLPAELKPETLDAWTTYLNQENQAVNRRANLQETFFWVDGNPARYRQVRSGETLVDQVGGHNAIRVPSGLIHHWIGSIFIPGATIEDVLAVTRDYANYQEYFKPGVAAATPVSTSERKDEFIIRFVNASVLSRTSLEGTYRTEFFPVNDKCWYSTSLTTNMSEIKDYGKSTEKRFAPNTGSGYIWRLYSTARLEDRDGGVLLELEAVALSRDIPSTLRWFAEPIVRRLSRESLEKSLQQTAQAARTHAEACAARTAHSSFGPKQIIVAGTCSQHPSSSHADYSGVRNQKLAGNSRR